MREILYWGWSEICWANPGYQLRFQHRLSQRTAQLFQERAQDWLDRRSPDPPLLIEVVPCGDASNGSASITGETILQLDPVELRTALDEICDKAAADVEEQIAIEMDQGAEFVRRLKDGART